LSYFDHPLAHYSDFFNETFDLGKSFLSHIDGDALDLVSTEIFDSGYFKLFFYRKVLTMQMKE